MTTTTNTAPQTTTRTWVRAFSVGQSVQDLTVKRVTVGTVTALDPFGYIVDFSGGRVVFMPEWNLSAAPHRVRTTEPAGWHVSGDSAGLQSSGGRTFDRTSAAVCSCGWSQTCNDRPQARAAARLHKSAL